MKKKKKLLSMIAAKEEARTKLVAKSETSEDVAELRDIHSQLEALNVEIAELRGIVLEAEEEGEEGEGQEARTQAVNQETIEQRTFVPGAGFKPIAGADFENREKKEKVDYEKRGKDLIEKRAVTVASGDIILPVHKSDTINTTFNQVSSLVDRVSIKTLQGGESYSKPYVKGYGEGDYTEEGAAAKTAETQFDYATMAKAKITSYAEDTEEVLKLPAANYAMECEKGVRIALRRKIAGEILIGDGATNHLMGIFNSETIDAAKDIEIGEITNTTLNEIIFSFGGDEDVEDSAVLILNKNDLKAFSEVRTATGEDFYKIVHQGNTGTINSIPYIINSKCKALTNPDVAVGAYCMAYGPLSNYELAIFSDTEIQRSTDYKFKEGMIAHRGVVFVGGNVVAHNGFLRVKKKAQ